MGYSLIPGIQLGAEGEDASQLFVKVAMNGEAFSFFPELNRPNLPTEVIGNFLPGIQASIIATGWMSFRECRRQFFHHDGERALYERSDSSSEGWRGNGFVPTVIA